MQLDFDTSELTSLAADLGRVPDRVAQQVPAVVSRGALNIKKQLKREMGASRSFGSVSRAISYDLSSFSGFGGGEYKAEIGPEKGSPGSLANIAYFGTSRGGGTVPTPDGALAAEGPRFESALGKILEGLL